jgi:hypothetical protein
LLDAQAKAASKHHLVELQEELEEAQRFNDPMRAANAQAAIDCLTDELATVMELGGRHRKAGPTAERARWAVTRSIKATLKKIRAHHPALGHHLTTSIKTGTFCSYTPDPTQPLSWIL